jgi:signal recognition particle receptor subunit alpha
MSKNVAAEVANALCESIKESLLGTKVSTFESVHTLFTNALRESVTRILTPNRKVDILRDIAALEGKRPYVISFVGVNGVGKSTSLSKVCKWLQLNNLKVFLAACDTFRSGAIEQIKVHARNLGVPVFERPYGSDAAGVAKAAIQKAAADGYDVVLVDTAGRMQDNEPLMRALAKLIEVNTPDLVVFVGEALVGNDGVDQLRSFHQALKREGTRGVDGIFLTKFDTIDDKVGAALSMVYTTGQPVLFVGCGQTYMDLKRLHVGEVVRALLE